LFAVDSYAGESPRAREALRVLFFTEKSDSQQNNYSTALQIFFSEAKRHKKCHTKDHIKISSTPIMAHVQTNFNGHVYEGNVRQLITDDALQYLSAENSNKSLILSSSSS